MSTTNRRQTRASSRGTPSARGPSPPILDLHNIIINDPDARPAARRARGESLPAIVPHESTAYGGAGIVLPTSIKKTERAPLEKTLENMLEEEDEDEDELAPPPEPARPRQNKTPSVSRATPTPANGRGTSSRPRPRPLTKASMSAATGLDSIAENAESNHINNRNSTPAPTTGQGSAFFETPSAINAAADIDTPSVYGPAGQNRQAPSPRARASMAPERPPLQVSHASAANGQPDRRAPQPRQRTPAEEIPIRNQPFQPRQPLRSSLDRFWKGVINLVVNPALSGLRTAVSYLPHNWVWFLAVIVCLGIGLNCTNSLGGVSTGVGSWAPRWYGCTNIGHNLGQFIPSRLAHPTTFLDTDGKKAVTGLLERMRTVEYDIEYLKRQVSLDAKTIGVLEKSLPDFIVSKKDKSGNLQIPQDFWNALKDKIHEEPWNLSAGSGSTTDISSTDITRMAPKLWDEWMAKNEAKIRAWKAQDFEQAYNNHIKASFKNDVLVSKSDLVKMLEDNFRSSTKDVHREIKVLSAHLETEIQSAKTEAKKASLSKDEITTIVSDYVKKALPKAQLEALAKANLNSNLRRSLARFNHFSLNTGALIMPSLTGPTYNPASARGNWLSRQILSFMGRGIPAPNVPSDALAPWEEHGDCWCATGPEQEGTSKRKPPQLGVLTGRNMYPDEIIIEHIPQTATISPDSTPQEFEVLVYIEDGYTRRPLLQQSINLIPDQTYDHTEDGYVRIAKFRYDRNGPSVQAFPTQLRLGDFVGRLGPEYSDGDSPDTLRPHTRKFIVRALSNYGEEFTCLYRVRVHGELAHVVDEPLDLADESMDADEEL